MERRNLTCLLSGAGMRNTNIQRSALPVPLADGMLGYTPTPLDSGLTAGQVESVLR
jgi:hypothetical protein